MNWGVKLIRLMLRLYKVALSPALHFLIGPFGGCRFTPTCSVYAAEAVALHGVIKGTVLAVQRICRCHPWGGCGEDPVPQHFRFHLLNWRPCGPETDGCGSHVDMQRPVHFGCPPPQ
jgi:putative membrane protein insertion efficiency factor